MDDYLSKPIDAKELQKMIEKWAVRAIPATGPARPPAAAEAPEPGGERPLDIDKALVLMGGDREMYEEVLSAFLENLPVVVGRLLAAVRDGDAKALNAAAHGLKGGAAAVAAEPIRAIAERLEELVRNGEAAAAQASIPALEAQIARLNGMVASIRKGEEVKP